MSDINFLSGSQPKDDGKKPVSKAGSDDFKMHVPAPEPPKQAPASLDGLKSLFPKPLPSTPAPTQQTTPGIFSSKIAPGKLSEPTLPKMTAPPPPPAPPKPPVAPPVPAVKPQTPNPKPQVPAPKPPTNFKPPPPKDAAGAMRVSLISTGNGAGLSEMAIREKMRTFILVMALALVLDALIFGGITLYKSRIGKQSAEIEADIKVLDGRIAEAEKRTAPANELQDFLKSAEATLIAHQYWTNLLVMLQSLTRPDVKLLNLAGSEEGTFMVDVSTKNYTTLAGQIVALRKDPRIKDVDFSAATFDDADGTRTNFSVTFDPSVLKLQAKAEDKK